MRLRRGTIKESVKDLQRFERRNRNRPQELRVKVLRLIKEHPEWTNEQVAKVSGRSKTTVQRWWDGYQRLGLEGLLEIGKAGGQRPSRLDLDQMEHLQERLKGEGFLDLKEVQRYLAEEFGVGYSYSGTWYLVRIRLKAKLKTGRRKALGQDAEALEDFKKKSGKARPYGTPGVGTR